MDQTYSYRKKGIVTALQEGTDRGRLQVTVLTEDGAKPVENAVVRISYTGVPDSVLEELKTDSSGQTPVLELAALLLAATLLLAACGDRDNKDNSQTHNGTNSGVTDNSGTNGSGTGNSGANSGTGNGTAGDNAKSRSDANSFQRMLDNARVHDTDGDLTDGENSRW